MRCLSSSTMRRPPFAIFLGVMMSFFFGSTALLMLSRPQEEDVFHLNVPEILDPRAATGEGMLLNCSNWQQHLMVEPVPFAHGSMKEAYKAYWKASNRTVVVLKLSQHTKEHNFNINMRRWMYDLQMLVRANQRAFGSTVEIFGYCADVDDPILILEYLEVGDFKTLIHQLREGRIKLGPSKRLRIASDIAKKLNQLHKAGFVICDFPNIGIGKGFEVKMIDGGSLHSLSSKRRAHCGRPNKYAACAPEIARQKREEILHYPATNVFEMGLILISLLDPCSSSVKTALKPLYEVNRSHSTHKFAVQNFCRDHAAEFRSRLQNTSVLHPKVSAVLQSMFLKMPFRPDPGSVALQLDLLSYEMTYMHEQHRCHSWT